MLSPSQLKAGTSKKMQIKYNRLVTITEKLGDTTYKVTDSATGEELKFPVYVDNLRAYKPESTQPTQSPTPQPPTSLPGDDPTQRTTTLPTASPATTLPTSNPP